MGSRVLVCVSTCLKDSRNRGSVGGEALNFDGVSGDGFG